jgi:AraC family transcriptional regulator
MLHRHVLFRSRLVTVADVSCRIGRGCGAEEEAGGYQAVFVRAGVFVKEGASRRVVAEPNTALFFNAHEPYRVSHPLDDGDECTALTFSRESAAAALAPFDPAAQDRAAPFARDHASLTPALLFEQVRLRQLLRTDRAGALEAEERALALLAGAAGATCGRRPAREAARRARTRRARSDLVEATKLVLALSPAEPHSLAGLARAVHSSPFHLARLFRAETGRPIHRYLLELRLALALDRLAAGERDLVGLAVDLGFASHSHFSATFRRVFGLAPAECRRLLSAGRLHEMRKILTA